MWLLLLSNPGGRELCQKPLDIIAINWFQRLIEVPYCSVPSSVLFILVMTTARRPTLMKKNWAWTSLGGRLVVFSSTKKLQQKVIFCKCISPEHVVSVRLVFKYVFTGGMLSTGFPNFLSYSIWELKIRKLSFHRSTLVFAVKAFCHTVLQAHGETRAWLVMTWIAPLEVKSRAHSRHTEDIPWHPWGCF